MNVCNYSAWYPSRTQKRKTFNLKQLHKPPELKVNWKLIPYSV